MVERWIKVAKISEVQNSSRVVVEGKQIALFKVENDFYAIDDLCPHRGGPLSEGSLQETVVVCPWHNATFELRTGESVGKLKTRPVTTYPVKLQGDDIEINLP